MRTGSVPVIRRRCRVQRQLGPTVLQQILFRLFGDQEQRFFAVARESRFDQLIAEMQSQLDTEGRSIQASDALPFDAVQDPHVANVLEVRFGFLWPGWWPGAV